MLARYDHGGASHISTSTPACLSAAEQERYSLLRASLICLTDLVPPDLHNTFVDLEWQQRNRLLQGAQETEPLSQWSRLTGAEIVARNRYLNVEPFAQNRVKLQVAATHNDYINASPIQLGTRRYIATQGPKNTSVNHFYRMLAASELKSPIVVIMLTRTHESGREKCFQYYPLSDSDPILSIPPDDDIPDGFTGEVELQDMRQDSATRSEVRRLQLRTTATNSPAVEKSIIHCLFSGWPDFLIPEGDDRSAMVELVRLSARLNSTTGSDHANDDQSNPRIIHCSAGVGRSGTFIALDYLLYLMHTGELDHIPAPHDPIAETVSLLRQQRMMMVQGESQFNLLYDVLRELMTVRLSGTVDDVAAD